MQLQVSLVVTCNRPAVIGRWPADPQPYVPELKVKTPAHTKQLGWYVQFEFRGTHRERAERFTRPLPRHGGGSGCCGGNGHQHTRAEGILSRVAQCDLIGKAHSTRAEHGAICSSRHPQPAPETAGVPLRNLLERLRRRVHHPGPRQ